MIENFILMLIIKQINFEIKTLGTVRKLRVAFFIRFQFFTVPDVKFLNIFDISQ